MSRQWMKFQLVVVDYKNKRVVFVWKMFWVMVS
jgi:hypothetical protein